MRPGHHSAGLGPVAVCLFAVCLFAAATPAAAQSTRAGKAPAPAPTTNTGYPVPSKPVPEACSDKRGIEQLVCTECDGLWPHQRLVCEQKLFWSHCGKGMRLFKDSWCSYDSRPPG